MLNIFEGKVGGNSIPLTVRVFAELGFYVEDWQILPGTSPELTIEQSLFNFGGECFIVLPEISEFPRQYFANVSATNATTGESHEIGFGILHASETTYFAYILQNDGQLVDIPPHQITHLVGVTYDSPQFYRVDTNLPLSESGFPIVLDTQGQVLDLNISLGTDGILYYLASSVESYWHFSLDAAQTTRTDPDLQFNAVDGTFILPRYDATTDPASNATYTFTVTPDNGSGISAFPLTIMVNVFPEGSSPSPGPAPEPAPPPAPQPPAPPAPEPPAPQPPAPQPPAPPAPEPPAPQPPAPQPPAPVPEPPAPQPPGSQFFSLGTVIPPELTITTLNNEKIKSGLLYFGYIIYECSVCRRKKSLPKDNLRSEVSSCVITKGCDGHLHSIGETDLPITTASVEGLTDWYPKNQEPSGQNLSTQNNTVFLATTKNGALTLALYQTQATTQQNPIVIAKFSQRRTENIPYQQYVFKLATHTTVITGRDSQSKNMRFDQTAIDESRVIVSVNGVRRDADTYTLIPNTVTFNTALLAGSIVDVTVYSLRDTVEKTVRFNLNTVQTQSAASGSWGNISKVRTYSSAGSQEPLWWYVYTSELIGNISSSALLKLEGIYTDAGSPLYMDGALKNCRFLLASSPYDNSDRLRNFVVELSTLHGAFNVTAEKNSMLQLTTDASNVTEIYPPLVLIKSQLSAASSYIKDDTYTSTVGNVENKLTGQKIIGPI